MIEFTAETQKTRRTAAIAPTLLLASFLELNLLVACKSDHNAVSNSSSNGQPEQVAAVGSQSYRSPTQTVDAFIASLQTGDVNGARALLALDPNLPQAAQNEMIEKLQQMAESAAQGWRMAPVAERIDGTCAVVIVHDRNPTRGLPKFIDLDPVFVISQQDTWLILLDNPTRETKLTRLSAEKRARYQQLHKWYETEQPALQAKLKSENAREN